VIAVPTVMHSLVHAMKQIHQHLGSCLSTLPKAAFGEHYPNPSGKLS